MSELTTIAADITNTEARLKADAAAITTGAEADTKAALIHGEAILAPAVADINALIANRVGDVLVGALVLLAVYIGHVL